MIDRSSPPVFIISAEKADQSEEENHKNTITLGRLLDGDDYAYKPVVGCYNFVKEKAFVISATQKEALNIALLFGQESILFLDRNRQVVLISVELPEGKKTPRTKHIGGFEVCTEEEALNGGDWVFDRLQDTYYHVIPPVSSPAAFDTPSGG